MLELSIMKDRPAGSFTLGASTTIAQYLLSPVLSAFQTKFPEIKLNLISGNSETIEQAVLARDIGLGIVEGKKQKANLKYADLTTNELIWVNKYRKSVVK